MQPNGCRFIEEYLPPRHVVSRTQVLQAANKKVEGTREEQIVVTPAMATAWSEENERRILAGEFRQRAIQMPAVQSLLQTMRAGTFIVQPRQICFDVNGNLMDGQHTLKALILFGRPLWLKVTWGWPPDTMYAIDGNRPRGNGTQLGIRGMPNANLVAAGASAFMRVVRGGHSVRMNVSTVIHVLDSLGARKNIEAIIGVFSTRTWGQVVGPLAYYHQADPEKAVNFARQLKDMEFLKGTPPWAYHNFRQQSRPQDQMVQGLCLALKAWDHGKNLSILRPSPEACNWMADQAPEMRDALLAVIGRTEEDKEL